MKSEPLSHNSTVSSQFGPRASDYLKSPVHATGKDLNMLQEVVKGQKDANVLDMGCGGGHVSFAVAPFVRQVIAFDLAPEMLDVVSNEAANRNLSNIETSLGDIKSLPFSNESFDYVLSRFSAHHWFNLKSGLTEAYRVLKLNGKAVFIDVTSPVTPKLDTHLQAIEILRDISHVRDYAVREWEEALESNGLRMLKQSMLRLRLDFSSWIQRMHTPENRVCAILDLQRLAPKEVKHYFEIEPDDSFTVDVTIFEAIKS